MNVQPIFAGIALIAALTSTLNSEAQAAFTSGGYCTTDTQTGGITTGDMTLNSNAADDCFGLVTIGGDVAGEIDSINELGWGTFSAEQYLKDDVSGSVSATFLGMDWVLSADNDASVGSYTLTVTDNDPAVLPDLPFETDIVGFLKAGTDGAFFLFEDVLINTSNAGTFTISWTVGENGANPGLSGLSLFVGDARAPGPGGGAGIPLPGTLLLLGVPLMGLGLWRRRANAAT